MNSDQLAKHGQLGTQGTVLQTAIETYNSKKTALATAQSQFNDARTALLTARDSFKQKDVAFGGSFTFPEGITWDSPAVPPPEPPAP